MFIGNLQWVIETRERIFFIPLDRRDVGTSDKIYMLVNEVDN